MHELSIVSSVLQQLEELQKQQAPARISKVGLRVGELAGVDLECLRFGFECVVKETPWEPLALEIEAVTRRQRCPHCEIEFECDRIAHNNGIGVPGGPAATPWESSCEAFALPFTACPRCGETATLLIAGEELQLAYIEVETSEVAE